MRAAHCLTGPLLTWCRWWPPRSTSTQIMGLSHWMRIVFGLCVMYTTSFSLPSFNWYSLSLSCDTPYLLSTFSLLFSNSCSWSSFPIFCFHRWFSVLEKFLDLDLEYDSFFSFLLRSRVRSYYGVRSGCDWRCSWEFLCCEVEIQVIRVDPCVE